MWCCSETFFTQIAHNKILYKLMWEEDTLNMLDERQKEFIIKHVPKTFSAKDVSIKRLLTIRICIY